MNNVIESRLSSVWYAIQVLAAHASLEKNDQWAWRKITREYSQKFSVPLSEVRKKPLEDVLYEVLESRLDDASRSSIFERIRGLLEDEESIKQNEEERIKRYEEEEKLRLKNLANKKPKVKRQKLTSNVVTEPVLSKTFNMTDPDKE
jgi:tyrosyl-tRNA synthetase